ncbi:MAG: mechanosensitive ion channel, partial [Candidatus Saccharibacteria bacterium]|nr:mechanosensitive ion channel [Candidatus Saccharibacteria bacterium]
MNIIKDIFGSDLFKKLFWSLVVIVVSLFAYAFISRFLKRREKRSSKFFKTNKNKTYLNILRNIIGATLSVMVVLTILQIFGVNVNSMLAGVGIASIVISFALQDAMKDIIRGFEIISNNYYNVSDIIKYGDNVGEVLSIGLRTTRLRDINSMNIVSIANRNIDQVE